MPKVQILVGSAAPASPVPLVVLHGGNGSAAEMHWLTELIAPSTSVFAMNLPGHGGRRVPLSISIDQICQDLIDQCKAAGIHRADWFGYSFGGLLATIMAVRKPELVRTVTSLATNFVLDQSSIDHMAHLVDPRRLAANRRGGQLAQTHAPQDWHEVADYNRALYLSFRNNPPISTGALKGLLRPALLIGAIADPIVSAQATKDVAQMLPNGAYAIFPGSLHPIAKAPLGELVALLQGFRRNPESTIRSTGDGLRSFRWDRH